MNTIISHGWPRAARGRLVAAALSVIATTTLLVALSTPRLTVRREHAVIQLPPSPPIMVWLAEPDAKQPTLRNPAAAPAALVPRAPQAPPSFVAPSPFKPSSPTRPVEALPPSMNDAGIAAPPIAHDAPPSSPQVPTNAGDITPQTLRLDPRVMRNAAREARAPVQRMADDAGRALDADVRSRDEVTASAIDRAKKPHCTEMRGGGLFALPGLLYDIATDRCK